LSAWNGERVSVNTGKAIRDGLLEAARNDPSVFFMAEGVSDPTAVYGTLAGIGDEIGADRMVEAPVSENALCGVAIGAAMAGKRPVLSFHRVEFAMLALDQILNNAAKAHYVSNGQHSVPMLLRLVVGRGWGQGPKHSQSLDSVFAAFPGLKVIAPVFPSDAKSMVQDAIQDDNPVICLENRWCHYIQESEESHFAVRGIDGPAVRREGSDATVVASSYMVVEALRAAEQLAREGISVEVVDLRVYRPFEAALIEGSVAKTGKLLSVTDGPALFGIGAEIVAHVAETCFSALQMPPRRLALPDHPVPSTRALLRGVYPDSVRIVEELGRMIGYGGDVVTRCRQRIEEERAGIPIDVPDAYFRGPF